MWLVVLHGGSFCEGVNYLDNDKGQVRDVGFGNMKR